MKIWHDFYGWKEDPFSTRPQTKIVGLGDEKEYMLHLVQTGAMSLLSGPTGSGKSSLLMWLETTLRRTDKNPIRINCLIKDSTDEIEAEIKHHRKLIDKLHFRLYPKKSVLLLDEAQNLNKDSAEFVKAQWDEGEIHSVVLATIDSTLKDFSGSLRDRFVGQTVILRNLSYNTAIKLISIRTGGSAPLTQEAIEAVVKASANIPRRILENCRAVCKAAAFRKIRLIDHNLVYETLGRMEVCRTKPTVIPAETVRQRQRRLPSEYVSPTETKRATMETHFSQIARQKETEKKPIRKEVSYASPTQLEIIRLLSVREVTSKEIASLLNLSPGSARKQISRLIATGAVRVITEQRPKTYGLTPAYKRMVIKE